MATPTSISTAHFHLRSPAPPRPLPPCTPRLPFPLRRLTVSLGGRRLRSPRAEAKDVGALRAGVSVYKPRSYEVLVSDAARSLACAIDDGKTRLEIEFP